MQKHMFLSQNMYNACDIFTIESTSVEHGSSVVECRTRNQVNPGLNPSLLPFRILGIFVLSIDASVHSAV